ncbi:hypothetical protein GGR56DRAFT_391357 [Xylariaceae sp. FL0804]|nr:hypothetical protein GGR56DRAFT_391357 [Xylariaceae sp. FL0804]
MAADLESSQAAAPDDLSYTRLHITPLDQSLLSVVVPASVLPRARGISYHSIETFPEKRYGFVDLPTADADKLRKKLNGAVLRGAKMRVEKARPEPAAEPREEAADGEAKGSTKKDRKKSKKRKRDVGVVDGVELEDRKVKRGWTTSEQEMIEKKRKKTKKDRGSKEEKKEKKKDKKDKKQRDVKSKYTDQPECLFKAKLPAADAPTEQDEDATGSKKKRKRKSGREVVIHEFEKTVKHPSFLKTSVDKTRRDAAVFKDGVGWVDSNGDVVEPARATKRPSRASGTETKKPSLPAAAAASEGDSDETSSSGSSSSDDDDAPDSGVKIDDDSDEEAEVKKMPTKKLKVETKIEPPVAASPTSAAANKAESSRPKSSGPATSLTIKIPPLTPAKVHPLEALYKRPRAGDDTTTTPAPQAQQQPFSFFGGNNDDEDEDEVEGKGDETETGGGPSSQQPPLTPFTRQDFEYRNTRSAAPTPDTAHPSRTFNLWPRPGLGGEDDIAEEDEDEDEGGEGDEEKEKGGEEAEGESQDEDEDGDAEMADSGAYRHDATTGGGSGKQQAGVSDFQKQFWERRGDLNRAWRRRRKTASKEKRYRDNRARAERAI